ncbi:MAG: hypothetical protein GY943_26880 [Chloroflexi bacterium]|nr:hypothetical protein [Chloroflexota bacterium]
MLKSKLLNYFGFVGCLLLMMPLVSCGASSDFGNIGFGEDVIFADTFAAGQMGDWVIEGDATGQIAIIDEHLVIEISEPNLIQYSALSAPTFNDFIAEVDVRQIRGDVQSSFGLLFRMQAPNQFYRFEITADGMYMLERHNNDGSWTRFIEDWTDSPAINQGLNVLNTLKVEAVGQNISVYVNDVLLQQISDSSYSGGVLALDAGTFTQPDLQVAFDNFRISQP